MEKIKIIPGSKGEEFIKNLIKHSKERKEKLKEKYNIPKKIIEKINKKTDETAKLNGEGFDRQTFKLGMHCMYFILKS